MAGTNGRGEDLPVAVLGTGIMGSEIARNWPPRACARRSGTGQHRSRRCCRTLARCRRAQRPRRSRMRGWSSRCCRPPRRYRPWSSRWGRRAFRPQCRVGPDGHHRRRGDDAGRRPDRPARPDVLFTDAPVSGSKGPRRGPACPPDPVLIPTRLW